MWGFVKTLGADLDDIDGGGQCPDKRGPHAEISSIPQTVG